jgi:hypothetical protein
VRVGEAGEDRAAAPVHSRGAGVAREDVGRRAERHDAAALDGERRVVVDRAGVVAGDDGGVVDDGDAGAHARGARVTAATGTGNSSGSIGISTIAGLPQAKAAVTASPTWSGCST